MEDWRDGKSLVECHLYMFDNSLGFDVSFLVGEERKPVGAHRYVLSCRSPVFQAMFMGPLACSDSEISLSDCDPETFKEFIRYLYGDIITINENNAFSLLYLSKKYLMKQLTHKIIDFLNTSISEYNCLVIYQQANQFDEQELKSKALKHVLKFADQILKSQDFVSLPQEMLKEITESDDLRVKEEVVFEAVLQWAERKCVDEKLDSTPENQRAVLGDNLYLIRFPVMDKDYFTQKVLDLGILTMEESNAVMRSMLSPKGKFSMKFKNTPRLSKVHVCRRFDMRSLSGIWSYGGKTDAIGFRVSRDIFVVGFEFFGPFDNHKASYNLTYTLYNYDSASKLLEGTEDKTIVCGQIASIEFEDPVPIQGAKMYTLTVTARGPRSRVYDSKGDRDNETVEDVMFEFFNSSYSTNGTRTNRGQIPGILFHLRR